MTTRGLSCIVASSSSGRRDLLGLRVPAERIEVVFNAVDCASAGERPDRTAVRHS